MKAVARVVCSQGTIKECMPEGVPQGSKTVGVVADGSEPRNSIHQRVACHASPAIEPAAVDVVRRAVFDLQPQPSPALRAAETVIQGWSHDPPLRLPDQLSEGFQPFWNRHFLPVARRDL